jgi:hypothetical protein
LDSEHVMTRTFVAGGRLTSMARILVLCSIAGGCAMTGEADRTFVVVDEAARNAGYGIEIDGTLHERVLPLSVYDVEVGTVVGPRSMRNVPDASFVVVSGPNGDIAAFEVSEVRPDLLFVRGHAASVEALALRVGADVESEEVGYTLLSPSIWEQVSVTDAIEGIFEALPASEGGTPMHDRTALVATPSFEGGAFEGASVLSEAIFDALPAELGDLVGVYSTPGGTLLVDAAGEFRLCGGAAEIESGVVRYENGRVFLIDRRGASTVLSLGNGGRELRGPDGTRYALVEGQ